MGVFVGIAILFCTVCAAVIFSVWAWKKLGLGGDNKFDQKRYKSVMDAVAAKDDLEKMIGQNIKTSNRATRRALEEDLGEDAVRRLLRC